MPSRTVLAMLFGLALFNVEVCAAEKKHFVLTSAENNQSTEQFQISNKDFADSGSEWSVTSETLQGGKQQGVQLVTINNGKMVIRIVPTRGMSILDVRCGDVHLGWDSPVKEVVHPQFVDLESRGGLGWLEGFNEWMVRCGLEFAGHPGTDRFINNTGDEAEMTLTLHGKIGNIPASEVEVIIEKTEPMTIHLKGIVHERSFYGPKLELTTVLSTQLNTAEFKLHDTVVNHGAQPQEMQIIYHTNYGAPLLEAGAKVLAPIAQLSPMNEHAAKSTKSFHTYHGPTTDFVEEVYLAEPLSDGDEKTVVLLHNQTATRGATIRWSIKELPYLTIWKNTAAKQDGYVTGLEPGTGFPFNRRIERHFGRVPKLDPGQKREFTLDFGMQLSADEVRTVVHEIATIQGGAKPVLRTSPPEIPE